MAFDGTDINLADVDASDPAALLEALGNDSMQNSACAARLAGGLVSDYVNPVGMHGIYTASNGFDSLIAELGPAAPAPSISADFGASSPQSAPVLPTPILDAPKMM